MNSDDIVIVCQSYVDNIGEITPYTAENLNDACQNHTKEQILYAIRQATLANVRTWKYVEAVLEKKCKYGTERNDDPERFTQGKYAHLVCTSTDDLKRVLEARKKNA
jgi:DnaD/phage-associated family protein